MNIFGFALQKLLRIITTMLRINIYCQHNFALLFANRDVDLLYLLNVKIPHAMYKLIILTDMFH